MSDEQGITPDEIIKVAHAAEFTVSKEQLRRWRDKGLIERPEKKGLGYKKGTVSFYPAGTEKQVIALCEILQKDRRLDLAAVALFFKGFPVSNDYILEILRKDLDEWKDSLEGIMDESGLTPRGWKKVLKLVTRRLLPRSLSRARKTLKPNFETLIVFLLYFSLGQEFYIPIQGADTRTDINIVIDGLGLNKARGTWLDIDPRGLVDEIGSLAKRVNLQYFGEVLDSVTKHELEESRHTILLFWQLPKDAKTISRILFDDDRLGFDLLPEIDLCEPNPQSASILLILLCLRRLPEIAPKLQEISETAKYTAWLRNDMENNPDIEQILPIMRSQLND